MWVGVRAGVRAVDHAAGMETMLLVKKSCRRHGVNIVGMATISQRWGLCRRHGDHGRGIETMPYIWDIIKLA